MSDNILPEDASHVQNTAADTPLTASLEPKHSHKKIFLVIALLLTLTGGSAVAYYISNKNRASQPVSYNSSENLVAAKPQYAMENSTAGHVKYNPAIFKQTHINEAAKEAFGKLGSDKVVIFRGNTVGFGDGAGLYLYDLSRNKVIRLTDGGGNPKIMSDHFVVYSSGYRKDDVEYKTFEVLDLQTGRKTTVATGNVLEFSGAACCSVSPDGFKLAIPRKNIIDVWDIRSRKIESFPAPIVQISKGSPEDLNFYKSMPYFTEIHYPGLAWLNNNMIVFADGTNTTFRLDGSSMVYEPINNTIYVLNTAKKEVKQLLGSEGPTGEIYAVADSIIFLEQYGDQGSSLVQFDPIKNSKIGTITPAGMFNFPSADGTRIFMASNVLSGNRIYDVNASEYRVVNFIPDAIDTSEYEYPNPYGVIEKREAVQAYAEGWLDKNLLLIKITESRPPFPDNDKEYEAVYDTVKDKVLQYYRIK